ncbi:MAG: hypothetical protein WCP31_03005 [Chloroflexales bacterium]
MEPETSATDAELQPLLEYLEAHRAQISLAALREELLAAGHAPELVDEAVRRVEANTPRKALAWPFGLLVMLVNFVVIGVLQALLFALASLLPSSAVSGILGLFILGLGPLCLIGEIVIGVRLTNGPRERLGRALIWGGSFSLILPVLLGVLLFGICLVFLNGSWS